MKKVLNFLPAPQNNDRRPFYSLSRILCKYCFHQDRSCALALVPRRDTHHTETAVHSKGSDTSAGTWCSADRCRCYKHINTTAGKWGWVVCSLNHLVSAMWTDAGRGVPLTNPWRSPCLPLPRFALCFALAVAACSALYGADDADETPMDKNFAPSTDKVHFSWHFRQKPIWVLLSWVYNIS